MVATVLTFHPHHSSDSRISVRQSASSCMARGYPKARSIRRVPPTKHSRTVLSGQQESFKVFGLWVRVFQCQLALIVGLFMTTRYFILVLLATCSGLWKGVFGAYS